MFQKLDLQFLLFYYLFMLVFLFIFFAFFALVFLLPPLFLFGFLLPFFSWEKTLESDYKSMCEINSVGL
jgi:hypothetical protein